MKNLGRYIWGIILIILGLIIGLNALEITNIDIFFEGWWTMFIIIPSAVGLFNDSDKTGNLIGLFIGLMLLFGVRGIINFELVGKLIVPIIFVTIGITMIFNESGKKIIADKFKTTKQDEMESIVAIFSEQKIDKNGENFQTANLDSVFGNIILDLREAKLKKETLIKSSAIFGAITIYVPENVVVKVKSFPIFGGVTNKSKTKDEAKNIIYIDAFCMFGGIDIK